MNRLLSFNAYSALVEHERGLLQQVFFILALSSLLLNFSFHIMLHQIGPNPLLYQEVDPVYWLFMILNLPYLVIHQFALLFDILLVLSCCCSIIWPRQNRSTLVFFILHFIYFILYNMLAGHHYINIGLLFMSFPFVFASGRNFSFAFTFMRFAFCFMMFTAALWKIGRGNLWHTEQLYALLLTDYLKYVTTHTAPLRTAVTAGLLHAKLLVHAMWVLLIFLEAVFVLGFLSFKYDIILLVSYILFFVGGWAVMDIYIYENLFFLLTLVPVLKGIRHFKVLSKHPIHNL